MGFGTIIHRFTTSPSTNDAARALAKEGARHGTVVVAAEQTRGRGTKGRSWHSPRGKGLYASFVVRPEKSLMARGVFALLPLAAGLAVVDAIRLMGVSSIRLKWPNDLFFGRRKLGGILTESVFLGQAVEYSVIGIGINVLHEEPDFPDDLKRISTSLKLVSGLSIDPDRLLEHLCSTLGAWYNVLKEGRKAEIIRAFEQNSAFLPGERVIVSSHGRRVSGFFRGLDAEGRLAVEADKGTRSISAEEVQALEWG